MAGGFRSPLFILGLSSGTGQAGFRSPLPIPPVSGGGAVQAGYIGPIPIINLAAGTTVEVPRRKSSGGPGMSGLRKGRSLPGKDYSKEEEELLMLCAAFLEILECH